MAQSTLPVLSAPHFPQVFSSALHSFINRVAAHPLLEECDYSNEHVACRKPAAVHHLESESSFCLEHFRKVVGRG